MAKKRTSGKQAAGVEREEVQPLTPDPSPTRGEGSEFAYIAERLRPLAVAISELSYDPNNYRVHEEADLAGIVESLRRYGIRKNAVVHSKTRVIVAGNGLVMAAFKLGWTHVPVVYVDDDAKTQSGYALADNRTAELSRWDDARLAQLVQELRVEDRELYDAMMLEQLDPLAEEPAEQEDPDDQEPLLQQFAVFVKAADESDQAAILDELDRHGLECRAVMASFPEPDVTLPELPQLEPGEIAVVRETTIVRSSRVKQLEGMFDIPPAKKLGLNITVKLPLAERAWNLGLIVGPSGCGKSSVARQFFGEHVVQGFDWPADKSLVDGFPDGLKIAEITGLLSSVGFSSPPNWLKPYHVLSNGEQFRVTLARCLAELPELAVVDEFTSVVDRQVAQIGSAAVSKAVRSSGKRLVAVTCHYDVEEWLQPDWKLELPSGQFHWRSLRRRPEIQLRVTRADKSEWDLFGRYHYLSGELHPGASCFVGKVAGRPACFVAVLMYPHVNGGWWREHRTVCLPEFQGVGIGNRMSELIAAAYLCTGKPFRSTTSAPAMIRHRHRSKLWRMIRPPSLAAGVAGASKKSHQLNRSAASNRLTAGFQYVGEEDQAAAVALGII